MKPRPPRLSKLNPFKEYIQQRLNEGVDNGMVLLDEIKARGYAGGYTIVKDYLRLFRQRSRPKATVRFETEPGEQAQVDFGLFQLSGKPNRKQG